MKTKHIQKMESFKTLPPFFKKESHPYYLSEDYIYPSDESLYEADISKHQNSLIEIKCMNPECKMSIRAQGKKVDDILKKLKKSGCPACKQTIFQLYNVKL